MEIDDVVDLSLNTSRDLLTITPTNIPNVLPRVLTKNTSINISAGPSPCERPIRRILRPRIEQKSYVETTDITLLPNKINGRPENGNVESEADDDDMPHIVSIKELSAAEIWERERAVRKLREDLRNEETTLVLLKKLKHSQQNIKENITVTPTNTSCNNSNVPILAISASVTKSSLSVTHATPTVVPGHSKNRLQSTFSSVSSSRVQPQISVARQITNPSRTSLPGGATLTPGGSPNRNSFSHTRTGSNLTITPSVTITPTSAPPAAVKQRNVSGPISSSISISPPSNHLMSNVEQIPKAMPERQVVREDIQTPAQRQAAAKLALRKQLEKTLLQIPPPKPPPPEMHFIPNPSNTEFVYLLGLEHVIDYITKEKKNIPLIPQPFRCAQCKIDFTPVWKWEKQGKTGNATFQYTPAGKDPKVICEQCVTTNVKKALKAEHTNRLKTAFVKALQQEQEIEQRLAKQNSPSPVESHPPTPTPIIVQPPPPKPQTPTPTPRPTPPPPHPPTQPTPPLPTPRTRHDPISNAASAAQLNAISNLGNMNNLSGNVNASILQAFHQQVFRGLQQGLGGSSANAQAQAQAQAHLMQFNPLLYSYQLSMAHQALASAGKNLNVNEIQRLAEMQRQYLLEMIPQQTNNSSNSRQSNWKQ